MKKTLITLCLAALLLGGCASQGNTKYAGNVTFEELSAADQKVVAVNREARRHGARVVWVNPPNKQ